MFYATVRMAFRLLAAPLFLLRIDGASRLPAKGAVVVVAEHRSWLDPPCVGAACRRPVRFLIRDRVFAKRWARWFYTKMGAIPVTPGSGRAAGSLKRALARLAAGEVVGIFPEGRVVEDGVRAPYREGAALIAVRSGAPVQLLGIGGTARAWPKGRRFPRPAPIRLRFGELLTPPANDGEDAVGRFAGEIEDGLRRLSDRVRDDVAGR